MKRFGKSRYNMKKPEDLLKETYLYKKIISFGYQRQYNDNFNNEIYITEREHLRKKRNPKIERINQKIMNAKSKTQQVTPIFLDKLIGLYERKRTTQKDKCYILIELKKYYTPKIIMFFFKLNDTEMNRQLRTDAFHHLQEFNYHPRLRKQKYMQKHIKNKKRKMELRNIYAYQETKIKFDPDELEYRIRNSKEQQIKEFDYFISHSSRDSRTVQKLINYENGNGKNIFCDWISDVDYLKRNLLCEATLRVIEFRLQQSNALIYVMSENSLNSVWCNYELNYYFELGKPIYIIKKERIEIGDYELSLLEDNWFINPDYKSIPPV